MKPIVKMFGVISILALCSCATKGTMDSLEDNRQQMGQIRGQVDRTMYALENLMRAPAAEIKDSQNQYGVQVKALREMTDDLEQGAKTTRERKIEYLTEWERAQLSVDSAQLKRASEQRRKEVVTSLTAMETALHSAMQDIGPLVMNLEDIERITRNDPTQGGIAAVRKSGVVQTAKKQAATANYRLDFAANRYERALATLAPQPGTRPVGTAAAPGATGAAGSTGALGNTTPPSFVQTDSNQSGAIEPSETSGIVGFDFVSADRDKDGKLNQNEYEAAIKARSESR